MVKTIFDIPITSIQPSFIKFSGSDDLMIVRIDFDFETSYRRKVFGKVINKTLPDFFCKLSRFEYFPRIEKELLNGFRSDRVVEIVEHKTGFLVF